jgi:hypothetical protein
MSHESLWFAAGTIGMPMKVNAINITKPIRPEAVNGIYSASFGRKIHRRT